MKVYIVAVMLLVFMFTISFTSAQNINIISPSNNTNFNTTSININYTMPGIDYALYNYTCGYIFGSTTGSINCGSNNTIVIGAQGNNTVVLYVNSSNVIDSNISFVNYTSVVFNVDTIGPTISITSLVDGRYYKDVITSLFFNVSSDRAACWFNNGTNNIVNSPYNNITNTRSHEGSNTWIVYANDSLGNIGSQSITFYQDTIAPQIKTIDIYTTYNSAKLYYTADESVNASIKYNYDSTNRNETEVRTSFDASGYVTISPLKNATTFYYSLTICDRAGNCVYNPATTFRTNDSATVVSSILSCSTTYTCGNWNACEANGFQIRTCSKLNISCAATLPTDGVKRTCNYTTVPIDERILTTTVNDNANATKESITDKVKGMSIIWKFLLAVLIGGILCWMIYAIYNHFSGVVLPSTTEYNEEFTSDEIDDMLDR